MAFNFGALDLRQISINVQNARNVLRSRSTSYSNNRITTQRQKVQKAYIHVSDRSIKPFIFPFTPQQIEYTNLSPELTEINRPGKTPIIAFNRYRSRQISFRFLLAVPQDGLFVSIDEYIEQLYKIANSAKTIYFTNLDRQITNALTSGSTPGIFWSIIDFSVSSIRRNADNQIVTAEANMTLVENTNPKLKVAELPKISYTVAVPQQNAGSSNKPKEDDVLDYTQVTGTER